MAECLLFALVCSLQRVFMGDGLACAQHDERQRLDMGLTIHCQLVTTGDEARVRQLVQQLRQAALDLPFQHVGVAAKCLAE